MPKAKTRRIHAGPELSMFVKRVIKGLYNKGYRVRIRDTKVGEVWKFDGVQIYKDVDAREDPPSE